MKPIDYNIIAKRLNLFPYQQLYFSSFQYGNLQAIFPESLSEDIPKTRNISSIQNMDVLLITGIASPKPLLEMLKKFTKNIDLLSYDDHHHSSNEDMEEIKRRFNKLNVQNRIIITTEKDATRISNHPNLGEELKPYNFVQPIEVKILQNQQESFNQQIIGYVRENSRNSSLS